MAEKHLITADHNFTLVAFDVVRDELTDANGDTFIEYVPTQAHKFLVSREVLGELPYFRAIFAPEGARDSSRSLDLPYEDDRTACKLLLQILHGCHDESMYRVSTLVMWNAIDLADKYGFDLRCSKATAWFGDWYLQNTRTITTRQCRELLYPAWRFDHAHAFGRLSKQLAYNVPGHIEECMPEGFDTSKREHRLPSSRMIGMYGCIMIGAINGLRGSLRSRLHANLYGPITRLLTDARCPNKKDSLWAYEEELHKTGAWPIESEGNNKSINELIGLLHRDFKDINPHPGNCSDHFNCGVDFKHVVTTAINKARDQFDGLCLDCMQTSSVEAEDQDYWRHAEFGYFRQRCNCRLKHSQPSWYFSFMGRKERQTKKMDEVARLKLEEDKRQFEAAAMMYGKDGLRKY